MFKGDCMAKSNFQIARIAVASMQTTADTKQVKLGKEESLKFLKAASSLGFKFGPFQKANNRYPILNQDDMFEVMGKDERKIMKTLAEKSGFTPKRKLFPDEEDNIYFFEGKICTAEMHTSDETLEFDYTSNY